VVHDPYPSKEALDAAGTGAADAMGETFEQLDELLVTLSASVGQAEPPPGGVTLEKLSVFAGPLAALLHE